MKLLLVPLLLLGSLNEAASFAPPSLYRIRDFQIGKEQTGRSCDAKRITDNNIFLPTPATLPLTNERPTASRLLAVPDNIIAGSSMALLAIQFGAMPTLQKKCVPRKLCRSTMIMVQEVGKFTLCAICLLSMVPPLQRAQMVRGWSIDSWFQLAAIPATLYAIQNYAKLMAYQHLSPVTYSILNQTKTLSSALFCFLLLGIRQSPLQLVSLVLLMSSALVIVRSNTNTPKATTESPTSSQQHTNINPLAFVTAASNSTTTANMRSSTSRLFSCVSSEQSRAQASMIGLRNADPPTTSTKDPHHFTRGILPLLVANLTSGLAAALGQRALQHQKRNLYLYGMELSSASFLVVLLSLLLGSPDGKQIRQEGIGCHWNLAIGLPIAAHAVGGLLVGTVTKYAGSVQKGFALIFGVLLSGLFQKWLSHEPVTRDQVLGGLLACISVWMHASFPPSST